MLARILLAASVALMASQAVAQEPNAEVDKPMPPAATAPPPASKLGAPAPTEVVLSELTKVDNDDKVFASWGVTVDAIDDMVVYDANGKKIAEVDEVVGDRNGEVRGVVIGYGGFFGFGETPIVITVDQLEPKGDGLVTLLTEEQLSQKPAWMKH